MSSSGKIFLRNITVLDAASVRRARGPVGISWHVDVILVGQKDEEGILLDFSSAKKMIKTWLDDEFDHKLLVSKSLVEVSKDRAFVSTEMAGKTFALNCPVSQLALIDEDVCAGIDIGNDSLFEKMISERLREKLPSQITSAAITLRRHESQNESHYFGYTHSLQYHKGNCQRFHGHGNVIEVYQAGKLDLELSNKAAMLLSDKYLVAESYVCSQKTEKDCKVQLRMANAKDADGHCFMTYSGTQGTVFVCVPQASVLLLPNESTIENIADFVHARMPVGATVFAFEGLLKGAVSE